jgi:hypothetical protein
VLAVAFYAGGGWYFSGVLNERALEGAERRASTLPDYDLTVTAVTDGAITLAYQGDPGALAKEGIWGLRWDGGYGRVGKIVTPPTPSDEGEGVVTRVFEPTAGVPPAVGDPAEMDVRAWPEDPKEAGLDVEEVIIPGPMGDYPAWFLDGTDDTWAIVVHGNSMTRADGTRMLPILQAVGLPTLAISYRNDPGAPEDPSGKLRYGQTEWRDLQAAVQYAFDNGAEEVVLAGYSMGGGIIASFLQHSDLADRVAAVVWDAPMLDFSTTVDDNASRETLPLAGLPLPQSLTSVAKWMAGWRYGVDWGAIDYLEGVDAFDVPILIFHGDEDLTVPIATSEQMAELRPDLVELIVCPGADHIECWNLDPRSYEEQLQTFLDQAVGSQG